jgi:4-amino-4-deoxychorismate lyase
VSTWVNGRPSDKIDSADRGLLYGDGLFETMRVRDGRIALLEHHLDRLLLGCRRLLIPAPRREELRAEIGRAAARRTDAVAKLIVTRGVGQRGYKLPEPCRPTRILSMTPTPALAPPAPTRIRLCRMRMAANPRVAGLKTLNRLESVIARSEWRDQRIGEGLLLDARGHIVCGTMTNVFVGRHGRYVTPKLDRCGVAGVMRRWILETARSAGIRVREGRLGVEALLAADEVFLSNAVIGIWSVGALVSADVPVRFPLRSAAEALRERFAAQ